MLDPDAYFAPDATLGRLYWAEAGMGCCRFLPKWRRRASVWPSPSGPRTRTSLVLGMRRVTRFGSAGGLDRWISKS